MTQCIKYTSKYSDATNEFRIVNIPSNLARTLPGKRLLDEIEWRKIGITQSRGWVHVDNFRTKSGLYFMFRRPIGTDPVTGKINADLLIKAVQKLKDEEPWFFDE